MSYQIVENDVRLIRRMLVCFNCKEYGVAKKLHDYLEHKCINMILPKEQ